jgi:hypothetical protein
MAALRKEVRDLMRACEAIQSLLAQKETLTAEERDVIEYCVIDLLGNVKPPKKPEGSH